MRNFLSVLYTFLSFLTLTSFALRIGPNRQVQLTGNNVNHKLSNKLATGLASLCFVYSSSLTCLPLPPAIAAIDQGANDTTNTKIKKGGASTLQRGISKVICGSILVYLFIFHFVFDF